MVESEALYYIDNSTVTWQAKTGEWAFTEADSGNDVLKGDKLKLSFKMVNNTAEDKTFTLLVAVYNDDGLIWYIINEDITIIRQAIEPQIAELSTPVDVTYDDNYYSAHNLTARRSFGTARRTS